MVLMGCVLPLREVEAEDWTFIKRVAGDRKRFDRWLKVVYDPDPR